MNITGNIFKGTLHHIYGLDWTAKSKTNLPYNPWSPTYSLSGRENFFLSFSDSHLAPKFFKVVANSKKVFRHFQRQTKPFCYAVSVLDRPSKIKLGKRSLRCYKVDTRMDDIQRSSPPKSKMASSYPSRCMCCVLETNLTRKFAADLSLLTF